MNSDPTVKTFAHKALENSSDLKSDVTSSETSQLTKDENPNCFGDFTPVDTKTVHGPIFLSYGDLVGLMDDITNAYGLTFLEYRLLSRFLHTIVRRGYRTFLQQSLPHKIDFYSDKLGFPKQRISEGFLRLVERGIILQRLEGRNKVRALTDEFISRCVIGMPCSKPVDKRVANFSKKVTDLVNDKVAGEAVEADEVIPKAGDTFENSHGFGDTSVTDLVIRQSRICGSDSHGFGELASKIEVLPILSPSFQSRSLSLPGQPGDNSEVSDDAFNLAQHIEGGPEEAERFIQQQIKNGIPIETIRDFIADRVGETTERLLAIELFKRHKKATGQAVLEEVSTSSW